MTNQQLKAFLAVAEHGSFRKAAEAISRTQAAVSAAVKALENEYGVLLFSREAYRPRLTEAGEAFYRQARLTVEHLDRLDRAGRQLAQGIESKYFIAINAVFPLPGLLESIRTVIGRFPHTRFKVFTEVLHGVVERIDLGEADLAFGPDPGLTTRHEKVPISSVELVNVAAPGYFAAAAGTTISLEEVRGYSQIVVRDSSRGSQRSSQHVVPDGDTWSVNDLATKKALTLAGFGWGRMPEHLIAGELASGELVPVHVEGIPVRATQTLYMFRDRNCRKGPVAVELWTKLNDVYADQGSAATA